MQLGWGRYWGICLCLLALGALAGCGSDGGSEDASAQAEETGIPKTAPEIEIPAGLPPTKLVVKELHKGTGEKAEKGDIVKLQYRGLHWQDGIEESNSWKFSEIPSFRLGEHRLARGLNLAVPGMREGGGREVIVPDQLVFYPELNRERLGRLNALIYKVYLVDVVNETKPG
jgi:peptidylprolyl isomerase